MFVRFMRKRSTCEVSKMITLLKAELSDAEKLWKLQVEAFAELLERYQDFEINPAAEPLEKTIMRLQQPFRHFYFVMEGNTPVGAISVRVLDEGWKKLGPLWVQPVWRGKGIAQEAIRQVEEIHGSDKWVLDTILQEKGNCHLYEKMGYHQTGKTQVVNERMTLVDYVKE